MKERKRCPGEYEIQALIDGELSAADREMVIGHAEKCRDCDAKIEEMTKWSMRVKQSVRSSDPAEIPVPQWAVKEGIPGGKRTGRLVRQIAAAAALIALIVMTTTIITDRDNESYKPTAYDLLIWEENSAGNDANRLWHNRSVTVMITGPDGETEIINLN
jgi:hypothetical protein